MICACSCAESLDAVPGQAQRSLTGARSTPESGARAGYDGRKKRKVSKVHRAVDTPGQLLAVVVTPASGQERAQVAELAEAAFADQGCAGWTQRRSSTVFGSMPSSSLPPSAVSSSCRGAGLRTQLRLDGPLQAIGSLL